MRSLLLLLIGTAALPLIGLLAYQIEQDAQSKVTLSKQLIQSLALTTAKDTASALLEIERTLGKLAERPLVRALDAAHCDPLLPEMRNFMPNLANVGTVDALGNLVCSSTPLFGKQPLNLASNDWFKRVQETNAVVLGDPMHGVISRRWITPMALPLFAADGRFNGALVIAIHLAAFAPIQRATLPPGVVVGITDRLGVIVARSERAEELIGRNVSTTTIGRAMLAGRANTEILVGNDGTERFYTYQPVGQTGWTVAVGVPTSQVYANAWRSVRVNSVGALGILALAALLVGVLLRRITLPLMALRDTVRAVGTGHLERRAHLLGPPEQRELALAFNQMMDRLPVVESALREREEQYRRLFLASPDAIRIISEGRVVMANPAADTLYGDCIDKDPIESLHPDHRDAARELLGAVLRDRQEVRTDDTLVLRADGSSSAVSAVILPFEYKGKPAAMSIVTDISAQKQLASEVEARRTELARLARLQVAKQTASAIAHDLNQPLVAVAAYSDTALEMLRQGANDPARMAQALEGASAQALRAGETLHTLMNFLQKGETDPELLDLNRELAASVSDETRLKSRQIDIILDTTPERLHVLSNRVQLQMVLATLLQNAADALGEAGGGARRVTVSSRRRGAMAQVSVHDSGPGIAPAHAALLFEPFFTSKPTGIGLGLSISRTLIESLGGQLWHDPGCSDGTLFQFTVPLAP
jgi:PAS domain S-box-containing protein